MTRSRTSLVTQADEIIDADTDLVRFAEQLDVQTYRYGDAHPDWHDGTPFRPMSLAYLWATVEQESLSGIPNGLADHPDLAEIFGLAPDDLPSESTFNPVWLHDRFSPTSNGHSIRNPDSDAWCGTWRTTRLLAWKD